MVWCSVSFKKSKKKNCKEVCLWEKYMEITWRQYQEWFQLQCQQVQREQWGWYIHRLLKHFARSKTRLLGVQMVQQIMDNHVGRMIFIAVVVKSVYFGKSENRKTQMRKNTLKLRNVTKRLFSRPHVKHRETDLKLLIKQTIRKVKRSRL